LRGNLEWRQVLSLWEAVGTTTQERNGKVRVELGGQTDLRPPDGRDVDHQLIVDLRRMLTNAGLSAVPSGRAPCRWRAAAATG
jgi:hypothetical protein